MPTATALRFALDAKVSQFTVHAFASGLASVVAHDPKFAIREFSGEAHPRSRNSLGLAESGGAPKVLGANR
jgi:hypothetical protein